MPRHKCHKIGNPAWRNQAQPRNMFGQVYQILNRDISIKIEREKT